MRVGVVTPVFPLVTALLLSPGCSSGATSSGTQSVQAQSAAGAPPVGHPLRRGHVAYVGHIKGGVGSYDAKTKVIDTQGSLPIGHTGKLLGIPGIGAVSVTCSGHPLADFKLTTWAQGEGPPTVTHTVAETHGVVSLAGLAGRFTLPKAETGHQVVYQWQVSNGGGEAFQFSATLTALLTRTATRCDLLGEAAAVTTGAFDRYAH